MKVLATLSYTAGSAIRKVRAKLGLPINEQLIRFCGIQRSGNHAVINWIIAQESKETCFINGAFPGVSPWKENWGISYPNFKYWPKQRDLNGALVRKELMMYSYEDRSLAAIEADRAYIPKFIGKSEKEYVLVILRDPYNTFASWLKRSTPVTPEITNLWKAYAYEFLGQTNILSGPKVVVSFNSWFSDQSYRQRLAEQLGLTFTDDGLTAVSHHGGGSSFDGQSHQGNAKGMNILTRFHHYWDDPTFQAIFASDPELKHLSDEIFGSLPVPTK